MTPINNKTRLDSPPRMFRPIEDAPGAPERIIKTFSRIDHPRRELWMPPSRTATHRVLMRTFDEAIEAAKIAEMIDNAFSQEGLAIEVRLNKTLDKLDILKKIYSNLSEF